jgi:hypothetical protein
MATLNRRAAKAAATTVLEEINYEVDCVLFGFYRFSFPWHAVNVWVARLFVESICKGGVKAGEGRTGNISQQESSQNAPFL